MSTRKQWSKIAEPGNRLPQQQKAEPNWKSSAKWFWIPKGPCWTIVNKFAPAKRTRKNRRAGAREREFLFSRVCFAAFVDEDCFEKRVVRQETSLRRLAPGQSSYGKSHAHPNPLWLHGSPRLSGRARLGLEPSVAS